MSSPTHRSTIQLLAASLAICITACAGPQVNGVARHYDLTSGGVMLEGHDPVAYIRDGKSVPGDPTITHVEQGATYWFASAENRALFAATPSAYPVAWGGWCAWAVSHDGTFGADPQSFIVRNGRLYLFHDSIFFDARSAWLGESSQDQLIAAGDRYWSQMTR